MEQLTQPRTQLVTAVISQRVRKGREQGYEDWMHGIAAAAREFPGHLGVSVLRPQPGAVPDYVIVLQFDTCDHLKNWLGSDIRKEWLERAKPLITNQESIQILTGLESWFQLPTQVIAQAPQRYKQALLIWVGVMTVSLVVSPLISPWLALLPWPLGLMIQVAISVILLSYVIMPQLTRLFKGWLYAN